MPGLTDLLQKLRDAGIRCAVGSSGYKPNVDFVLEKCRIEPYFDARISGDMVSRCKPDPEIYLTAATALGLPAAECVVFEDAPAGIEASTQGRSRTYRGAGHDARPRSAGADRCGQGHRRFPRHHRPRRFAEITRAQKPDRPSAISAAPPPRRPAVVIDGFRATPARQRSAAADRQHRRSQGIRTLPAAGLTQTHRTPDPLPPSR